METFWRRKYLPLEIAVFVCGAVVMIFELIGSRILAPYVGTSIYVWTALIGVILACLSAGYYFGGKAADLQPDQNRLAIIIGIAAISISLTALTKDVIAPWALTRLHNVEWRSLFLAFALFSPASFLLGMTTPYAAKLRVHDLEKTGATVGSLYALSTFGSIFGTFLAGFWLIPTLGSTISLYLLSLVLLLTAFLLAGRKIFSSPKNIAALLIFLVAVFGLSSSATTSNYMSGVLADRDTAYNRIIVFKGKQAKTGRPTLNLRTDPYGTQAAIFTDGSDDLVFDYTNFFHIADYFKPNIQHTLMIGGAAYTFPRDFLATFPEAKMDVVEIDPGMTEVAEEYFGLTANPRLSIIHADGRIFLNENENQYDVLFNDAFSSFSSIPFQLTTIEAIERMYAAVKDDGVVMVNVISAMTGKKGQFLRAEYATFKKVFPQVYVFPSKGPEEEAENQNIMIVALKSPTPPSLKSDIPEQQVFLSRVWRGNIINDVPILTDDFAPVEFYKRQSL